MRLLVIAALVTALILPPGYVAMLVWLAAKSQRHSRAISPPVSQFGL